MYGEGYSDIGYQYIIGSDGTIYEGRDIGVRGAHVERANTGMIGVLLLGDFEPGLVFNVPGMGEIRIPIDSDDLGPTALQVQSTTDLVRWLDRKYGINAVIGHNDVNETVCPGAGALQYIPLFNLAAQEW